MPETREQEGARGLGDFADFFQEVHGYRPFPWQEALVARVCDRGWPSLIDVPTGLGKTAVLDVAVFLSARGGEHARRRVFLVVDRRIIVDQAHAEAEKIAQALGGPPPGSMCSQVRARLTVPGDESGSVVEVARMRGGVNWSWLWIERPDRHAVITGTVDQIGSRLLFRGYGVGERLRPIDAAMVGTDSLIFIDEAHLSDPFLTTLKDVLAMDGGGVGRRPIVVAMSASPDSADTQVHGITDADLAHPVAGKRLRAPKSVHPVAVTASKASATSAVADALAHWAKQLGGPGKVIGIVANTVHMAREVFERLRSQVSSPEACALLTGRVRPIDREYLLNSWYPRLRSNAGRDPDSELYVVSTQTIEAGADIDFDGMVTQTASLSALVQRLGRVNRMGELGASRVVVVHADKLADPVYGSASAQAWSWLTSLESPLAHKPGRSGSDLGSGLLASPARLRELVGGLSREEQARMQGAKSYVPLISQSTLDAWARTSPTPHPDAPVGPYLHGIGIGEPTVSVLWRTDLQEDDPESWVGSVDLIPPSADEVIELPISTAKRWLKQLPVGLPAGDRQTVQSVGESDISDLESQAFGEIEAAAASVSAGPPLLRYRNPEERGVTTAQQVRAGDYVILPSGRGGCDLYGWHPGLTAPVTDLADFTGWRGRRTAAIRIGPTLRNAIRDLAPDLLEQIEEIIAEVQEDIADESVDDDKYRALIVDLAADWGEPRLPHECVLSRLTQGGHLSEIDRHEKGSDTDIRIVPLFMAATTSWNEDESAPGSSASQRQLTLVGHQAAVACRAREFASNLGMPGPLVRAVQFAGLHHDEGKRDPRFQAMLHGGDRLLARVAAEPLAKSGMDPADKAAFRRAADLSGYPSKMRHEALSERIAASMLAQITGKDFDTDLVVHLVAAHHGFARPLLPAIVDGHSVKVPVRVGKGQTVEYDTAETVNWDAPERFGRLCGQYGRWGLALLESIVRLADMWCSARSEGCDDQS